MKKIKALLGIGLCMFLTHSCVMVKPYEMMNLNDPDMLLGDQSCDKNLTTSHSYREASSGATGGKSGGGCGCN